MSSLCSLQETADALKVPRRPTVEAVHVGPHKKSTRSGEEESTSQMYKIFLAQPANEEPTVIAESTCTSTIIRDIERAERIELLEIFGCVQKLNSPEITRWRQIAEVDLRKKYKSKEKKGDGKNPSSVKIAGVY